jgi:hypothetical protein
MDSRRTLSFLAQGTGGRRMSRAVATINDEQDFELESPSDLTIENLQRRRSSRVSLNFKLKNDGNFKVDNKI